MASKMMLRDLLDTSPIEAFWVMSETKPMVFKFSEMFSQILQAYLDKLEYSHISKKVHQWENGLMDNVFLINDDPKKIGFLDDPIVASQDVTEFNNEKERDYAEVANLIESVHGACFSLPPIENGNELSNFLQLLRQPLGDEKYIHKHFCLWSPRRRADFLIAIQCKSDYAPFRELRDHQFKELLGDICTDYPNGFWEEFRHDPVLYEKYKYMETNHKMKMYTNTHGDFMRFIRNCFSHYFVDSRGNPHCLMDIEWRIFQYFPFYLMNICLVLDELYLYFRFK